LPLVQAKICGLSTPATLDAAVAGGASHVGLVFYPPSPRHLSFDKAEGLASRIPQQVGRVGVFVDPEDAMLNVAVQSACLTALQLHKVSPQRATAIGARFGLPLWIAIPVRTRADLSQARAWRGLAERIIYDAKTPAGALPGGMGMRFDWTLLDGFDHPAPWALSGGLAPDNVAEAVRTTGARMLDVSSGVESAPGVKDVDKIARFLQSVAAL
jgi:phosphoribosylanthranilate isomerase